MVIESTIFVRFRFEGFHQWLGAPEEVDFLRRRHRHEFHVEAEFKVEHDDRDIEFILMKREMMKATKLTQEGLETNQWSCERWAREILLQWDRCVSVRVSEDGENGAMARRR